MQQLVTQLGAGPFFLVKQVPLEDVLSRGEPASFGHDSAFGACGDSVIELIKPARLRPARVQERFSGHGRGSTTSPMSHPPHLSAGCAASSTNGTSANTSAPDSGPSRTLFARRVRSARPRSRDPRRRGRAAPVLRDGPRRPRGVGRLRSASPRARELTSRGQGSRTDPRAPRGHDPTDLQGNPCAW